MRNYGVTGNEFLTEDMVNKMSMVINGDTFTTFEDLWESSNLTQAEKDEIEYKNKLIGKLIEARQKQELSQSDLEMLKSKITM